MSVTQIKAKKQSQKPAPIDLEIPALVPIVESQSDVLSRVPDATNTTKQKEHLNIYYFGFLNKNSEYYQMRTSLALQ